MENDTVTKSHNLILVGKAMYDGILRQLAPSDPLDLYYTFGHEFFARGTPYLFGHRLPELILNQANTLLRMLTGETQTMLAVARRIQIYITRNTKANINKKLPTTLLDWMMEEYYSPSGIEIDPQMGYDSTEDLFPSKMASETGVSG